MRLGYEFYNRKCTDVAKELVGKILVRKTSEGEIRLRITETEAYLGADDTACHAHKGRTKRTEVMYMEAGTIYVYLCYGMHLLMNIVTDGIDEPCAVLIRACEGKYSGPAKLTKALNITKDFNRRSIVKSPELWIEDDGLRPRIKLDKRVGIDYASEKDRESLLRFILDNEAK